MHNAHAWTEKRNELEVQYQKVNGQLNCIQTRIVFIPLHCKPIPVMKTGFSLCTFSHREKPVSISWDPCNENRFFPVGKKYTGKSLFWPCTDHVRDGSVGLQST